MASVQFLESLTNLIVREGEAVSLIDPNLSDGARPWDVVDGPDSGGTPSQMYIAPVDIDEADGKAILATDQIAYALPDQLPSTFSNAWHVDSGGTRLAIQRRRNYSSEGKVVVVELILRG